MPFNRGTTDTNDLSAQCMGNRKRRKQLTLWFVLSLTTLPLVTHADATAPCNVGIGPSSTECGVDASATLANATALGTQAEASGASSTALGTFATATANFAGAIGYNAQATGISSAAFGRGTTATATGSTSVGNQANATAAEATAIGRFARANSANSTSLGSFAVYNGNVNVTDSPGAIAIGYYANISPASPGGIAIGGTNDPVASDTIGAQATGENAIAIGFEARANQPGSIALGANVEADKAHTMTVGVPIEVRRDDGSTQVLVNEKSAGNAVRTLFNVICDTCTPGFRFNQLLPNNNTWNFRMLQSGAFSVDDPATAGKEAEFRSGGDLKIGGTLFESSSRTMKTDIHELDFGKVLSRLQQLPISQWSYKKDNGRIRHIGPMAEDFHALFKLGSDSKSISSLDTSGVALAAIKALKRENDELKLKDNELARLLLHKDRQIAQLRYQFVELREMLTSILVLNQSEQMAEQLSIFKENIH